MPDIDLIGWLSQQPKYDERSHHMQQQKQSNRPQPQTTPTPSNDGQTQRPWGVFTVRENEKGEGKDFWIRLGSAFHHKGKEGMTIILDGYPTNGKLIVIPPKEDN